jgi:hypothetical protein
MNGGAGAGSWDFFISYTQADRAWAEWVAWMLEEDRHRVLIQAWDFVPGSNWIHGMQRGMRDSTRTIAVMSDAYLKSVYSGAEWQAAWASDPDGTRRKLLVVRVEPCVRPGVLAGVVSVDLFGLPPASAKAELRRMVEEAAKGRAKPPVPPSFPGPHRAVPVEPSFPGYRVGVTPAEPPHPVGEGRTRRWVVLAGLVATAAGAAGAWRFFLDGRSPAQVSALQMADDVTSVAFSPDGRTLAGASGADGIRLWNVSDPAHPAVLRKLPDEPTAGAVHSVAFSGDGRMLAGVAQDGTIQLWNVADPARPAALSKLLTGGQGPFGSVACSLHGHVIASGGVTGYGATEYGGGVIQLWNLSDPANPTVLGHPLTGDRPISSVAVSPDGRTLAAGKYEGFAELWNISNPAHPVALANPPAAPSVLGVGGVAFSPNGRMLAGGADDGTIRLWNVSDPAHATALGATAMNPDSTVTGTPSPNDFVAFSPDSRTLAGGTDDGTIRLWNVTNPAGPTAIGDLYGDLSHKVISVAFSPDGHTVATGDEEWILRLWNLG